MQTFSFMQEVFTPKNELTVYIFQTSFLSFFPYIVPHFQGLQNNLTLD